MDRLDLILNKSIAPILGLEPHKITSEVFDSWLKEHPAPEIDHSKLDQRLLPLGVRGRPYVSPSERQEMSERVDRFLD